ncbi:hypothetical protein AB1Y20_007912 [Prymnesium parvum]|uniref:Uncharacterized protein n=1 Tax=Prymnesium parvum TaxID=97485 RepID=A0AB34IWB0_PRYPA
MALRVALLLLAALEATAIDAVHKHMEPAPPYPTKPFVRHPLGASAAVRSTGLLAAAARVVRGKGLMVLLPVTIGAAVVTNPEMAERVLLHLICFIGSLFEPYDSILPKNSFLKFFIKAVQKAKRDYDVKYGLVSIEDQTFFDSEDELSSEQKSETTDSGEEESTDTEAKSSSTGESSDDDGNEPTDEPIEL